MKKNTNRSWGVYIVRCKDKSLYTGIAKDIPRRVSEHNKGNGAKYIRGRTPVVLVARRTGLTQSKSLILESKVKGQQKENKIRFLLTFGRPSNGMEHKTI